MRLVSVLLAFVVSVGVVQAEPAHEHAHEHVITTDPGASQRKAANWTMVAAGGLFASSISLSLYERSEYHDAVARHDIPAANHAVMITRNWGTGLFLTGGLVVGVALYLRATAPEKHTIITPAVAPNSAGAVLSGSF
jgi:hypothetical protein